MREGDKEGQRGVGQRRERGLFLPSIEEIGHQAREVTPLITLQRKADVITGEPRPLVTSDRNYASRGFDTWCLKYLSYYIDGCTCSFLPSLSLFTLIFGIFFLSLHFFNMTGVADEGPVTLDMLKQLMAQFAEDRDWDKFHTPRNLLLAMVGEVGELSEIFQWKGEVQRGLPDWKEEEKVHLGEELSDVLLYLVRLSDICGVDLGKAALRKVQLNALKYPSKVCLEVPSKQDENSTNNGH
ncbi:hypothetical protein RJT34_16067 [Clitoria ternatea]|uniref:NTP pyrophosphohydrolase MazG-like domain-containing protein n=1 Tax=Clitoria ternatea TaxID=43366 RepID=A0AAN9J7P0_CLITE